MNKKIDNEKTDGSDEKEKIKSITEMRKRGLNGGENEKNIDEVIPKTN